MHLHLSKSSFFANISMISHRSLAAVSVLLSDPFCFWAKSDAKLRPFFEPCKFSSIFLKTFFSGRLRRSVGQGRFPFCGCKGTAICRTDKIFQRKNSNKFSQIFTHHWHPTTYTKNFFTHQNRPKKAMCEPPHDPHIILYRKRIFDKNFSPATIQQQIYTAPRKKGNDIQVVPKKMRWNSVRNLMCVGRYAEKM